MALLIIDWKNPIKHILDMYGGIPEMIGTVLEFLTIICGELNYTNRTDLCPEQICARNSEILTGSADLVYDFMVSCLGYKGDWRSGDFIVPSIPNTYRRPVNLHSTNSPTLTISPS